jgi:hypothetical protein
MDPMQISIPCGNSPCECGGMCVDDYNICMLRCQMGRALYALFAVCWQEVGDIPRNIQDNLACCYERRGGAVADE